MSEIKIIFSLYPAEVKKVIDSIINGMPYDKEQFLYYHLYRNHFNVKNEVTTLTRKPGFIESLFVFKKYIDNKEREWEEMPVIGNKYHMPDSNWKRALIGIDIPYSRKFLLDDRETGIGGEFEMIIRYDGKRMDALLEPEYQETYNFGRSRNFLPLIHDNPARHKKLDIDPHNLNKDYTFKKDMGYVKIIE